MAAATTTLSLLLSCLIILHLHTNSILTVYSQQIPQALVLDSNGDYIQTGVDYYIQPLSPTGRTIGLFSGPNPTCPLDVVLQPAGNNALPVKFSLVDSKDNEAITTRRDTNIIFSTSITCATSTVWRIQASTNGASTTYFVEIGGVKGNPGSGTLNNWFNFVNSNGAGYVINFCPSVCSGCRPVCGNIGLIVDSNGRTRLGITSGAPLLVKFVKTGF